MVFIGLPLNITFKQTNSLISISENIRRLNLPRDAANAGRDRKKPLRTDWEEVKDNIMRFAVLEKFKQHKEIR